MRGAGTALAVAPKIVYENPRNILVADAIGPKNVLFYQPLLQHRSVAMVELERERERKRRERERERERERDREREGTPQPRQ